MPLPADFADLAKKVNNWGRWGSEDERGTLNLITADAVRRGVACARTGRRFSLSIPLHDKGPQTGGIPGRVNPLRTMIAIHSPMTTDPANAVYSDDVVVMGLQAATHWDSLAHVAYDGRLYNGFPPSSVDVRGAGRLGIDKAGTIATRGVLLDVARARGEARLAPAHSITPEELDAAEAQANTRVEPGDVVLIRTGHMQHLRERDRRGYGATPSPGAGMACAEWFHERDVAAAAIDTMMFEVWPWEREDCVLGLHLLCLVEMGMIFGENWDLEDLAVDCAADGVWEVLLEASPLPFARGLGAPVHPVAIK